MLSDDKAANKAGSPRSDCAPTSGARLILISDKCREQRTVYINSGVSTLFTKCSV